MPNRFSRLAQARRDDVRMFEGISGVRLLHRGRTRYAHSVETSARWRAPVLVMGAALLLPLMLTFAFDLPR